ncbi:MAG: tetratricopeptide repeat protein [Deltaproteobacteria bacterium]|nr:tetratricopeptide repeat protein [Deltaproteobacteria bacterium]
MSRSELYDELEELLAAQEANLPENVRLVRQAHRAQLNGESAQAAALFEEAVAKGRREPGVLLDLARVYLELAQPAQAVTTLEEALRLENDSLQARSIHLALSQAHEALGHQEEARRHYQAYQQGTGL